MRQGELNLGLQVIPDAKKVDMQQVESCTTPREALRLCMQESNTKRSQAGWGENFTKSAGTWSHMLSENKWDGTDKFVDIDHAYQISVLAGNVAFVQWLADRFGYELVPKNTKQKQINDLKERITMLEQAM